MSKPRVLFLCTGNSVRSQMAQAFMKKYAGDRYEVYSAGLKPKPINPYTIRVMAELGIDLSAHQSTHVRQYLGHLNFGYLFTVCSEAEKDCPRTFLNTGGVRTHWYFEDPAAFQGTEAETLARFRQIRDQIDHHIRVWLAGQDVPAKALS